MKTTHRFSIAWFVTLALILLLQTTEVKSQSVYNKKLCKAIEAVLGKKFLKGYQMFSYPVNNFGLASSYQDQATDIQFICDTWNCIGEPDPTNLPVQDWLSVKGYAATGSGAAISLSNKDQTSISVNAMLPKLYEIVGISGGFDRSSMIDVQLTLSRATKRLLRKDRIQAYINGLDNASAMKDAYNQGRLVLIVGDVILEDLTVTITVKNETAASLEAKVNAGGIPGAPNIFKDAGLEVKFEKQREGVYTFKINKPVVFARLAKSQPGAGTLGADNSWDDWKDVKDLPELKSDLTAIR